MFGRMLACTFHDDDKGTPLQAEDKGLFPVRAGYRWSLFLLPARFHACLYPMLFRSKRGEQKGTPTLADHGLEQKGTPTLADHGLMP